MIIFWPMKWAMQSSDKPDLHFDGTMNSQTTVSVFSVLLARGWWPAGYIQELSGMSQLTLFSSPLNS